MNVLKARDYAWMAQAAYLGLEDIPVFSKWDQKNGRDFVRTRRGG